MEPTPMPYEIETGVPIPSADVRSTGLSAALRALSKAEVGASLLLPLDGLSPTTRMNRISAQLRTAVGVGWYRARSVEGGIRVWKIGEPKPGTAQRGENKPASLKAA
jgi:hypothetical protein